MGDIEDIAVSKKAMDVMEKAIALPNKDQSAYLHRQCGGDPVLLKKVQALMGRLSSDESFFSHFRGTELESQEDPGLIGENFGVYRLNSKLGSGGMADVYSATRTDGVHDKPVALKLVRGWGDTQALIARFGRERKILAGLKHPNIAHFLDGGVSEDGRPYYSMEYVEGEYLNNYCQENNLSIEQRLKLFIKVCAAVASAHQQLVIHRDLKPSNILVNREGEVKLLDFGIAKIMDREVDETDLSVLGVPMTPRYGSPEQYQRETLTTASDQYSLGVLLYELLTGHSPYDVEEDYLFRAVCETVPRPPSQSVLRKGGGVKKLSRELAGDLDTIVLKALQKKPERRYSSVQQFTEDIERYLATRPVLARRDSLMYLSTRFVQRNVAAVSIVVLLLVSLFSVGFGQQLRVIKERDLAQLERENAFRERENALEKEKLAKENEKRAREKEELATQVQDFMVSLFEISAPGEAKGNSITAREILDRGVEKIKQGLDHQAEAKSALLNTMGVVYRELGLYETSSPLLQLALALRRQTNPSGSLEEAESLNEYATLLWKQGKYSQAEASHLKALNIYLNIPGYKPLDLANNYRSLGVISSFAGKNDQAIAYYEKALSIFMTELGEEYPSVDEIYLTQGADYRMEEKYDQVIGSYTKNSPSNKRVVREGHRELALTYHKVGRVYLDAEEAGKNIYYFKKELSINRKVSGEKHPQVASIYFNLGLSYRLKGEHDKAIEYIEKSLRAVE